MKGYVDKKMSKHQKFNPSQLDYIAKTVCLYLI